MGRFRAVVLALLGSACTVAPDQGGFGVGGPSQPGPTPGATGWTSDDPAPTTNPETSTGAVDGLGTAEDSTNADSESGLGSTGPDDGTTTGPGGQQPPSGAWSDCLDAADCMMVGMGCLNSYPEGAMVPSDGVCTTQCVSPGDPSGCAPSPGGTAVIGCITTGGTDVCALDCTGGLSCPGGMVCTEEQADTGVIEICI